MSALPVVQPRKEDHIYKGVHITLTYVPDTGNWAWSLVYTIRQPVSGSGKSANGALSKAKQWVDKNVTRQ